MATKKSKGKRKDEAGSTLGENGKPKAKRAIKVTAVHKVDFASSTAPATVEKREEPKAQTQTAPKKPTVPGVRPMRSRPYLAGVIIAKYGLEAGYTPEMVKELNELFGKENNIESEGRLAGAWHSIRGYLGIAEDSVK